MFAPMTVDLSFAPPKAYAFHSLNGTVGHFHRVDFQHESSYRLCDLADMTHIGDVLKLSSTVPSFIAPANLPTANNGCT